MNTILTRKYGRHPTLARVTESRSPRGERKQLKPVLAYLARRGK